MKTLLILRHAKSSWKEPQMRDHDRPLNARGKAQAPRIGQALRQRQLIPDLILTSTAKRARKTTEMLVQYGEFSVDILELAELYLASPETCVEVLRAHADAHACVLLVGHNPGLEQLVSLLGRGEYTMSTATLAEFVLPIDHWTELTLETTGELRGPWREEE